MKVWHFTEMPYPYLPPLDEVSTMITLGTPVAFPSYLLLADKLGVSYSELRVTNFASPPSAVVPVCMYAGRKNYDEATAALQHACRMREFVDKLEFAAKYLPKAYPTNFNGYTTRETGVGPVEEVAWIFANAFEAFDTLVERGVDIDLVAPKVSFTFSAMIDIFEEASKYRALRRIWARTLKERYGEEPAFPEGKVSCQYGRDHDGTPAGDNQCCQRRLWGPGRDTRWRPIPPDCLLR